MAARSIDFPSSVPLDHPARDILRKLNGKQRGRVEFLLLPERDYHEEIPLWNQLLDTSLVGIGLVAGGAEQLFVSSDGRCFGSSEVHDAFYYHADSLRRYMWMPLFRKRSRPMLRPDQDSVDLYGLTFRRGDSEVYYPPATRSESK